MYRAIVERVSGSRVSLSDQELRHLLGVRRLPSGAAFLGLVEGEGWLLCRLTREDGVWGGEVIRALDQPVESSLDLVLVPALIRRSRFETLLEKAAELGVTQIRPVVSSRTQIGSASGLTGKLKRWRRILEQSVKQSGRSVIPRLFEPEPLASCLCSLPVGALGLVLDEKGGQGLEEVLSRDLKAGCWVLVGPEGGWTDPERELFLHSGVFSIHLGPRILRAETAPLVILSILQFLLGDLGGDPGVPPGVTG